MVRTVLLAVFMWMAATVAVGDHFTFFLENDFLDPVDNDDQWYTDGWRATYGWDDRQSVFVGQNMYTPSDISKEIWEPTVGDRAYAAWLHVGYGRRSNPMWRDGVLYTEASLGVTGPSALDEDIQSGMHDIFSGQDPKGWDSQADDRLAAQGLIKYQLRIQEVGSIQGGDVFVGSSLGNINVDVHGGLTYKLGYGLASSTAFDGITIKARESALYMYAGVVLRYVAYDYFLEVSDVDPRTVVVDNTIGLVWETPLGLDITYQWTHRTRQFVEQPEGARFGAIGVRSRF